MIHAISIVVNNYKALELGQTFFQASFIFVVVVVVGNTVVVVDMEQIVGLLFDQLE